VSSICRSFFNLFTKGGFMKIKKLFIFSFIFIFSLLSVSCENDTLSSAKQFTAFNFTSPRATGQIDQEKLTIAVTVPHVTKIKTLISNFSLNGAKVKIGDVNQISGETVNDFSAQVVYTVIAEDNSSQDYTVSVIIAPNTSKLITGFSFNSPKATGAIDEENHKIKIVVPEGTILTSLIAFFTITGTKIKIGDVEQESGIKSNNFSTNLTYTVTAEDGSSQNYIVNAVIFVKPVVTTSEIAGNIALTQKIDGRIVYGGGEVISQGSSAIIERGLCWSRYSDPTIDDSIRRSGSGIGIFNNCSLYIYSEDVTVNVRAYATNSEGTAYGNKIAVNSGWKFGTKIKGGYVFYNDGLGGGLVCAPKSTEFSGSSWGPGWVGFAASGTAIGTGKNNTATIVNWLDANGHSGHAAQLCDELEYEEYNDWFLPAKDELKLIYTRFHNDGIGDLSVVSLYWSSTTLSESYADAMLYANGQFFPSFNTDTSSMKVRAIRKFN
jgi:hypothetical protein